MKNFKHVFFFTFSQKVRKKGYIAATLLLSLLFLVIPAGSMLIAEAVSDDETPIIKTKTVFVVDNTDGNADYSVLSPDGKIAYQIAKNEESALASAAKEPYAMVLCVTEDELVLLRPEGSKASIKEAELLGAQIEGMFSLILAQKAGLSSEQLLSLSVPAEIINPDKEESEEEQLEIIRQITSMIAPVLTLFILYFMVLLYGQSTANSAIMEKSSKLMDTFLLSVRPETMMLGKVCATALAGILQVFCWLAGLFGGFFLGKALVLAIYPESDMFLIKLLSSLAEFSKIISLPGLLVAMLVIIAGFFLYCSLAAVGGAMASKQEDLAQTNYIFTLTLVFSFLICIYQGDMYDISAAASGADWMCYFPFTALLVLPGKAMTGSVSPVQCLLSFGIIAATAVLVAMLAGKVYRLTAFYKGNPPKPTKVFEMLKTKKR